MAKNFKLSHTQKLAIKASYDAHRLAGKSKQISLEAVAQEMGVHWQTIRKVVTNATQHLDTTQLKDVKTQQATQIDKIVGAVLTDLDSSDKIFKGMSPAQSILAICQLLDKSLKLKGEDVTKIEIQEVGEKVEKRLNELQNLKEALKQSLTVPPNGGAKSN